MNRMLFVTIIVTVKGGFFHSGGKIKKRYRLDLLMEPGGIIDRKFNGVD